MNELQFTCQLMRWHRFANKRDMPWKGETEAYKIWLSEIILQQTRVEQGLAYYHRFISKYPTIFHLAAAADEEVFKVWEGLGYYNRCRNLLHTAQLLVQESGGNFPQSYDGLLKLKGVGPYTAAAIGSFAFKLPFAVVDGNVFRVLARVFGIDTPIDSISGKKEFAALAQKLLLKDEPAEYNQAIMDFGATICKPFAPLCAGCALKPFCFAFQHGKINQLPVKEKQLLKKKRWFNYFIFLHQNKYLVTKRTGKDIWQDLYEFYLLETPRETYWNESSVTAFLETQLGIKNTSVIGISPASIQQLTHQTIAARFITVMLASMSPLLSSYTATPKAFLAELPFPGLINQYLKLTAFQNELF